jgi:hypothetical protein
MRSLLGHRRLILFLAVLALGALTVLAISLNEVPFREAQRFRQEATEESAAAPEMLVQEWEQTSPGDDFLVWALLGLMIVLIGLVMSPELRKQMFKMLIRGAVAAIIIVFYFNKYGDRLFAEEPPVGEGGPPASGAAAPVPVFEPPEPSSTFTYAISFLLVLFLVVLLWGMYRGWKRLSLSRNASSLEEFARIARSSLQEISAGQNSSDVIINCYVRMSEVVSDKRKLQRADAMTPHEFALRLEQAGLPGDAVRRLTRLFEAVRYGDRRSGPRDVNEAVSCLQTILHYCGEPA